MMFYSSIVFVILLPMTPCAMWFIMWVVHRHGSIYILLCDPHQLDVHNGGNTATHRNNQATWQIAQKDDRLCCMVNVWRSSLVVSFRLLSCLFRLADDTPSFPAFWMTHNLLVVFGSQRAHSYLILDQLRHYIEWEYAPNDRTKTLGIKCTWSVLSTGV